jgi:hypothetical protein
VVVSDAPKSDNCLEFTLHGISSSEPHYACMGRYHVLMDYCVGEREHRAGPGFPQHAASGSLNRSAGDMHETVGSKCIQTTWDGFPVYKQERGDNYLYHYAWGEMWIVDSDFECGTRSRTRCGPELLKVSDKVDFGATGKWLMCAVRRVHCPKLTCRPLSLSFFLFFTIFPSGSPSPASSPSPLPLSPLPLTLARARTHTTLPSLPLNPRARALR